MVFQLFTVMCDCFTVAALEYCMNNHCDLYCLTHETHLSAMRVAPLSKTALPVARRNLLHAAGSDTPSAMYPSGVHTLHNPVGAVSLWLIRLRVGLGMIFLTCR